MILRRKKVLKVYLIALFLVVALFPKFMLISVPGSHAGIRLEDIMIAIYFLYFLIRVIKKGFSDYKKYSKLVAVLTLCLLSFSISNIIGYLSGRITLYLGIFYLVRVFEYFMLIFAGSDLARLAGGKKLILNLVKLIVTFHGCYAILEYFSLTPNLEILINRPLSGRVFTTFSGPYELAGYLSMCLPLILDEIFRYKKYSNIIFILFIVIGVVLSESRIALVAVVAIILVWIVGTVLSGNKREKRTPIVRIGVLAGLLALIVVVGIRGVQSDRFSGVSFNDYVNTTQSAWENADYEYYLWNGTPRYSPAVFGQTSDRSFAIRITKWTVLIKEALKMPLFGLGMSISGEAMDGSFVKLFCETGLVGLILWIVLLCYVYRIARRPREIGFIVLSMIVVLLINAVFIDIFDASKVMMSFWLIVGYYTTLDNRKKENNQKKILILSDNNLHTLGGSQQSIATMVRVLSVADYRVAVLMPRGKNNGVDGAEKVFLYDNKKNKYAAFFSIYVNLLRGVRDFMPDIVHAQNTKVIIAMGVFEKLQPINCVHYVMTDRMFLLEYKKQTRAIIEKMARDFDMVITTTNRNCREWKKVVGKEYTRVVPNVLDDEWLEYDEKTEKKLRKKYGVASRFCVGFSGRYEPYKRWDTVLEICKRLMNNEKIVFAIAITADMEYREEMKNFISILKEELKDRLILMRDASKEQMIDFYYILDCFVLTSRNESFGRVLIEAMTKNNIVLGTRSGGVPDILEEEYLFDVGDASQAVCKLLTYVSNNKKTNSAKRFFMRKIKNKYTIGRFKNDINAVYEVVLQ